jgi:hypothetical protein
LKESLLKQKDEKQKLNLILENEKEMMKRKSIMLKNSSNLASLHKINEDDAFKSEDLRNKLNNVMKKANISTNIHDKIRNSIPSLFMKNRIPENENNSINVEEINSSHVTQEKTHPTNTGEAKSSVNDEEVKLSDYKKLADDEDDKARLLEIRKSELLDADCKSMNNYILSSLFSK